MNKTGHQCIECGEEIYAIKIIDRGQRNIYYDFTYTDGDSKPQFFGKVRDIEQICTTNNGRRYPTWRYKCAGKGRELP